MVEGNGVSMPGRSAPSPQMLGVAMLVLLCTAATAEAQRRPTCLRDRTPFRPTCSARPCPGRFPMARPPTP